jgi:hypothetical protein
MGWIRISDDFYDNDKLSDVGPLGVALYFASMGFCNRNLTDGFFKKSKARLFLDFDGIEITTVRGEFFAAGVEGESAAKLVIEWMVAADLWHEEDHSCDECHARDDGGKPASNEYLIHDYLEFQFSVHVHDTPTPTPTPTVIPHGITSEGGVSLGSHQDVEPPLQCSKHLNHTDPPPCQGCRKAREANEAWHAGELDRRRAARAAAKAIADACPVCHGMNWIPDTEPAVKCGHLRLAENLASGGEFNA